MNIFFSSLICLFLILFSSFTYSAEPSLQCNLEFSGSFVGVTQVTYPNEAILASRLQMSYYDKYCGGIDPSSSTSSGAYFCGSHEIYINEDGGFFYDDPDCIKKVPCNDIGYNPELIYPSGYCPNLPDNTDSHEKSNCDGEGENEGTVYEVPECDIQNCPDGALMIGGSCPDVVQCWDGSVAQDHSYCPVQPVCNSENPIENCTPPDGSDKLKKCSDGKEIPINDLCPTSPFVECIGGSLALSAEKCPNPSNSTVQCFNGAVVQDYSQCNDSFDFSGIPNPNQTVGKITGKTTTFNPDGTTSISIEESDIDLSPVTSRQDKQIQDFNKFSKKFDKFAGDESDYEKDPKSDIEEIENDFQIDLLNAFSDVKGDSFSEISISSFLPVLPSSGCSGSINTQIFGKQILIEPCHKLAPLRSVLAWVFSVLTILSIVNTTFRVVD